MVTGIRMEAHGRHVDIVAATEVVDITFMMRLINTLAEMAGLSGQRNILLEVVAPKCLLSIMDRVDIWRYAAQHSLAGKKIAHVITGREVVADEVFKENYAFNRGIQVRTFAERNLAVAWLEEGLVG